MNQEAITSAMGDAALKMWTAKFEPRGLLKVVRMARAQEANSRFATASKSVETLKTQIAKTADGSIERLHLESDLEKMLAKVTEFSTLARAAADGTFASHESLVLLRDDLRLMVADLETELENIVNAYRKMHKAMGWPEPSVEYVAASCAPYMAGRDFLQGHLRPALAEFENEFNNFDRGAGISRAFDPGAASWILTGHAWRDLPLT